MHWDGHETAFVAAGDKAGDVDFKVDSKQTQRVFLTEILVDAAPGANDDRHLRRFDHRRRPIDPRRQPSLA